MSKERTSFQKEELERYSRHLLIPGFGREGQQRLKNSSVSVIGAGALGAPVLLYLAAAGVGRIRIIDPDRVEDHNLQRQVLFRTKDVGKEKAIVAKEAMEALNPWIQVEAIPQSFLSDNAMELLDGMDLIIDGSDNFPTRYLANDASVLAGIPNVHASVFRSEGQIAVFNRHETNEERGVDYRDLFPTPPPPGSVPGCNEGGVLGMLPGIMGSLQANEAIKILSGYGIPLEGELLIFDAWRTETRRVRIPKDPDHPRIEGLIDHEAFCGLKGPQPSSNGRIPTISPEELRRIMKHGNVTLVDVREPGEKEILDIGGQNIPLNELEERMGELEEDARIVLYCRSGQRSARGVQILQEHWPNARLQNLEGGVLAWIDRIDRSLPSY